MIITDIDKLRVKCEEVLPEEVDTLVNKLEEGLRYSYSLNRPGIGLAAPQIGIAKRACIIRITSSIGSGYSLNLINPKIVESFDKQIFKNEGCLSFPGEYADTMRYNEIVVENDVEPKKFVATGLLAVCIQHEIDHLNGVLLPDVRIK